MLHFDFHEEIRVSVESEISLISENSSNVYEVYGMTRNVDFYKILEKSIEEIRIISDNIMEIGFDNKITLQIRANNKGSSCSIFARGKNIFVE